MTVAAPKAVATDFNESFGQDVLNESGHELMGRQSHPLELLRLIVPVAEGDLAVLKLLQATIGQGNSKDIAAQVVQDLLTRASMLAVHHPLLLPTGRRDLRKPAQSLESRFELGAEDFAQSKTGDQESGMSGLHPLPFLGESTRRDQQVDMGMITQSSGPSVENGQNAQLSSHPLWIARELL